MPNERRTPEEIMQDAIKGDRPTPEEIMEQQKQPDSEDTETDIPEITWGEALKGLNPIGIPWKTPFWTSFAKAVKDTAVGIPQLPALAGGLAKELVRLPGAFKDDKAQWMVSVGTSGQEVKPKIPNFEDIPNLKEDFPILSALVDEYVKKYGSMKGFKETLATDPFAILSDLLPIVAKLKSLKIAGKTGKIIRGTGRAAELADPTNLPGEVVGAGIKGVGRAMAPGKSAYDPTLEGKVGRDPDTGKHITTEISTTEASEKFAAGVENTPAAVLSEADWVGAHEGWQRFENIADAEERFITSKEAILEKRDLHVETEAGKVGVKAGDVRSPNRAGKRALHNYNEWQLGMRGEFRKKFGQLGATLEQPLRSLTEDMELLPKTRAKIKALRASDSKILSNIDIDKSTQILEDALEELTADGLTLSDFDKLRTNYRTRIQNAVDNGEMTALGEGTTASLMYQTLTEDFYDILEAEVGQNPADFPPNFIDSVKLAKSEYRRTIVDLENSVAAELIRNNQDNPGYIIDELLKDKSSITEDELVNLKTILGEEGWQELQPALLSRIYDMADKDVDPALNIAHPTGLSGVLSKITKSEKDRLRVLFGEETAEMLVQSAEFAKQFGRATTWKRGSPTAKLQNIATAFGATPGLTLMPEVIHSITELATNSGTILDNFQFTDALNLGVLAASWGSARAFKRFVNSPAGRKWMLEGAEIEIPGRERPITAASLNKAADWAIKHKWKFGYPAKQAERSRQRRKTYRGMGGFQDLGRGRVE